MTSLAYSPAPATGLAALQHIVLSGISWDYYEHTLREIGKQPIRVAFLDGMMEILSILPEHESAGTAIGDLIKVVTDEFRIPRKAFGSTTFRREEKSAGTEPDECFYLVNIDSVRGMKRFDPLIHRAPDLWVEVDIFSPSVAREPICARLGVPEVWRFNGERLGVRLLTPDGIYADSIGSKILPFLPMEEFASFIPKMMDGDETAVTLEFRMWLQSLSRP